MRSKLLPYKMRAFLAVKHGYPFLGEYFSSSGKYIVLTPGNFHESGGFKLTLGKGKYYTHDFPRGYLCSAGDLVIAMTEQAEGLLGSTAIIPESGIYLHNQRIGLITCNEKIVDKLYLYYLFMTRSVRKQIRDTASGTKVKHTSPERIYDVAVFLPDKAIQQKNAALLWILDQKIQNNKRIISELEAMAKTIYDYWFVQFDFPNADGKPYRASGGEMVWSYKLKRLIPKNWSESNLYSIASFSNGIACQSYRPNNSEETLPVVKIREMHNGISSDTEAVSARIPENARLKNGDILFSWSASLEVMLWSGGNAGLNQHIFKVIPKAHFGKYYVYMQLSSYVVNFQKIAEARKTTMGHITSEHLLQSSIVIPNSDVVQRFESVIKPVLDKSLAAQDENLDLASLRDWLLPMLMNGQATIK